MRHLFLLLFVSLSFYSISQKVKIEGTVKSILYANDDENVVPDVAIKDVNTGKTLTKTDTYGRFSFTYDVSKNRTFTVQRKQFLTRKWKYTPTTKPVVILIDPDSDKYVKLTKGKALDSKGKPIEGAKAMNSYYKRAEYSNKYGEFLIRIPNPKYLETWESKDEAEDLVITVSKEGYKISELRPTYQSTLEDLIVKLNPTDNKEVVSADSDIDSVRHDELKIIEDDIDKNLAQLDTIENLNVIDVNELKEYISYLEDKLDHHEYNYVHEELGQSKTVNKQLHVKLEELKSEVAEKEVKIIKVEKERDYMKWIIIAILLFIIPSIIAFLIYRSKRKTDKLNLDLDKQNKQLDMAYSDIKSSVVYAEKIQRSLMIDITEVKESFDDAFVFYQPKDIVSGDFYWFSSVDDKLIIAAIDCTGHGVPGAFMTVMGSSFLNEIVNISKILTPSEILDSLHNKVVNSLQSGSTKLKDGMDASIAVIDKKEQKLYFCGANNPLYFISDSELETLEANKRGIGGDILDFDEKFEDVIIDLNNVKSFYLFSDGYQDQFGGEDDKKFMKKNFKNLLLETSSEKFEVQEEKIRNKFIEWKGDNEQTDDILVLGIKL